MVANNELEVVWSDRPWYNLRYHPDICMEEVRKSTKKSRYQMSRQRFEPGTSRMQVRNLLEYLASHQRKQYLYCVISGVSDK